MDLKEAFDALDKLRSNMNTHGRRIDSILDDLSSFVYNDLDNVTDAVDEALKTIDELEAERERLENEMEDR